jgi:hypothetical protein
VVFVITRKEGKKGRPRFVRGQSELCSAIFDLHGLVVGVRMDGSCFLGR